MTANTRLVLLMLILLTTWLEYHLLGYYIMTALLGDDMRRRLG